MNTAHRLAAGLLLLAAATAQATDIRPGLWEFRSTRMSAAGMPDMSAQMAEMQKQMKNLPPETQRMLQQQMAARGVQLGKDGAGVVVYLNVKMRVLSLPRVTVNTS